MSIIIQRYRPKKLRHTLPVRILHWLLAPSLLILLYTGIYIAHPRSVPFLNMRSARRWHFIFQFIFFGAYVVRIAYGFVYRNYRDIIPGISDLKALPGFLQYELFLTSKKKSFPKYNPLQKVIYTLWIPLFFLKILTGALLYAPNRTGWLEAAFGGLSRVRRNHYITTLIIGSMAMGHLYLVLASGRDKIKSMLTGYMPLGKK